ncbi:MAG: hypothetical protein JRE61_14085 [Deltaproteobacteria bacterium]|nr:hypothetical protein [Deltaproteobacteria bacterium]
MGVIDTEGVIGIWKDEERLSCKACMTDDEWRDIDYGSTLTQDDLEKNDQQIFFCDTCDRRLLL